MRTQGPLGPTYTNYLNKAIAEDSLISVRSLSSPFSAHTEQFYLSYAQSYSLVKFLISQYGQSNMLALLNTFKQGSNYDAALEKVYGFDMDGLDALWRDFITMPAQPTEERGMHPVLVGLLAALATGLILALSLAIESKTF